MDRILISDLSLRCIVGINHDERREKQDVLINLAIYGDLRPAGESDRMKDAIDYRALKKRLVEFVEATHFHLIEALAESIARLCLETPGVLKVDVRVEKPSALRFARSVGVEITRSKVAKGDAPES